MEHFYRRPGKSVQLRRQFLLLTVHADQVAGDHPANSPAAALRPYGHTPSREFAIFAAKIQENFTSRS